MTKCTLPPSKNYVVNIQITQSISPFLTEFASFHGVQPESLIFETTSMANISIPSSVTALDLMTDQETALAVFVRDRDCTSRRRSQPVAVDLESTFLQASDLAQGNPTPSNLAQKITAESRDSECVDTSDPPVDATKTFLQIMSGKNIICSRFTNK